MVCPPGVARHERVPPELAPQADADAGRFNPEPAQLRFRWLALQRVEADDIAIDDGDGDPPLLQLLRRQA